MSLRNIGTGSTIVAGVDLGNSTTSASSTPAATGGVVTPGSGGVAVLVDGQPVGDEGSVNFLSSAGLGIFGLDDRAGAKTDVTFTPIFPTSAPGILDIGAGAATGTYNGVTGNLTSTTGAPLDLNQDLVLDAASDQLFFFDPAFKVVSGAGSNGFLDILSVNSGRYVGDGIAGPGWPDWQWPASATTLITDAAFYVTTADDIVNGTAVFRLVYRVAAGTSTLLANGVDGHARLLAYNLGTVTPVSGQNTGAPPVTPPTAGIVTVLSNTARNDASTATRTLASSSVTPAASTPVYAVVMGHIEGITAAAMLAGITSGSMTDTWGGSGGTSWTLVGLASLAVAAPNTNNCNFGFVFRRTVGTGPSAGTATFTRPVGTVEQEMTLSIFQESAVTEAPTQPATTSANNTGSITQTLGPVGATSTVFAWLFNVGANTKPGTSTLPTTGGTWTAILNSGATIGTENAALAYLTGGSPGNVNWTGLLADVATSPAGVFVLDPSGSSTPAPGAETFTIADKSGATADNTWVDMSV